MHWLAVYGLIFLVTAPNLLLAFICIDLSHKLALIGFHMCFTSCLIYWLKTPSATSAPYKIDVNIVGQPDIRRIRNELVRITRGIDTVRNLMAERPNVPDNEFPAVLDERLQILLNGLQGSEKLLVNADLAAALRARVRETEERGGIPRLWMPFARLLMRFHALRGEVCIVCREDFEAGECAAKVKCGHAYHAGCLASWVEQSARCPMCTRQIEELGEIVTWVLP